MNDHGHDHHQGSGHPLYIALALTLGYALVEAAAGLWANSLTLLSDAGHMVTDAVALGMAALAAWLALHPPSARHSYGLGRAEVVAALLNALFMLGVVAVIALEAWERLEAPSTVRGDAVIAVAGMGLVLNALVLHNLFASQQTLNVRGAMLHVAGDLLGSIAALLSGTVIEFTGWMVIDPLLALTVCALILYSTLRLLRESLHVMMEGVPLHLSLPAIGREMAAVDHVLSIHDLHIWTLGSGTIALSAHVVMDDLAVWPAVLVQLSRLLEERFGIGHITLQPETRTFVIHPAASLIEEKARER